MGINNSYSYVHMYNVDYGYILKVSDNNNH